MLVSPTRDSRTELLHMYFQFSTDPIFPPECIIGHENILEGVVSENTVVLYQDNVQITPYLHYGLLIQVLVAPIACTNGRGSLISIT